MNEVQITYTVIGSLVGLVAIWAKVIRPAWHGLRRASDRVTGALDNLGGRDAFHDPATGKLVPRIPPLGERLTGMEATLETLANVNQRLDTHEALLGEHGGLLAGLLANTYDAAADKQLRAQELKNKDTIEGEVT